MSRMIAGSSAGLGGLDDAMHEKAGPMSQLLPTSLGTGKKRRRWPVNCVGMSLCWGVVVLLVCGFLLVKTGIKSPPGSTSLVAGEQHLDFLSAPVLVSYSYFEKDPIQKSNFEFFLAAGTQYPPLHRNMHWVFVISGDKCGPCTALYDFMRVEPGNYQPMGIKQVFANDKFTLIERTENEGMDLAAHNITLEYLTARNRLKQYKYFIMLNSSVKGPFLPSYMPPIWHWAYSYLVRFQSNIHVVSSSLVCLPKQDAGGPGPRVESWAFAVDNVGLDVLIREKVLHIRTCKLCSGGEGIVVGGEYGITKSMFKHGYNVATLMARYATGTDWKNPVNWNCNNQVHPSRHGTYDGIAFHPFEVVFVKSSWHVSDPYTRRYTAWALEHLAGDNGTKGSFDPRMYRYGVSLEAQAPNKLEEGYAVQLPP